MADAAASYWNDRCRATLRRYTDGLLRQVADAWLKPRTKKPISDLLDQLEEIPSNLALIDRRLKGLSASAVTLLALIDFSRQPQWRLGGLLELLSVLTEPGEPFDGLATVFELFTAGCLFPTLPEESPKLRTFEEWLARGSATRFEVFVHPTVARRAGPLAAHWPTLPAALHHTTAVPASEADGLELPLRLCLLWQQIRATPLRLTQQGDFFKRDADRLADPALAGPWESDLLPLLQAGEALAAWGLAAGLYQQVDVELKAEPLPETWRAATLAELLGRFVAELPGLHAWNAWEGWRGLKAEPSPFASVAIVALALLRDLPPQAWASPEEVAEWIGERHCFWTGVRTQPTDETEQLEGTEPQQRHGTAKLKAGLASFLAGLAYQLRLTQVAKDGDDVLVRLSPLGRAVLAGQATATGPDLSKTLLVQPNLQLLAFRQGLTPGLIVDLTRFADWKTLGAACTLELTPQSVYRGLETGLDHAAILQVLQRHSTKELAESVLAALRTWAEKRDRLSVYNSAALLEFNSSEELTAALARGVEGERITDRLLLVPSEETIDYRHFRLLGTRDYGLPPGVCAAVLEDGVTLAVDLPKADLLLEVELSRFAAPSSNGSPSERLFKVTPTSLTQAKEGGLSLGTLEDWYPQRTGEPLPPAVRLLYTAAVQSPVAARPRLVLELPTVELADGLCQWPQTRECLEARLGPTAVAVHPDRWDELRRELKALAWPVQAAESGAVHPEPITSISPSS